MALILSSGYTYYPKPITWYRSYLSAQFDANIMELIIDKTKEEIDPNISLSALGHKYHAILNLIAKLSQNKFVLIHDLHFPSSGDLEELRKDIVDLISNPTQNANLDVALYNLVVFLQNSPTPKQSKQGTDYANKYALWRKIVLENYKQWMLELNSQLIVSRVEALGRAEIYASITQFLVFFISVGVPIILTIVLPK